MGGEITKAGDILYEEQEWIPGVQAPFFIWAVVAGCIVVGLGTSWWIYQHNK